LSNNIIGSFHEWGSLSYQNEADFFNTLVREEKIFPSFTLNVGCGSQGEEVYRLASATQSNVVGVDLNIDGKGRYLTAVENAEVIRASVEHLPIKSSIFDATYAYHVLEHVRIPRAMMSEIRRTMRTNGVALVGTPNKSRLVGYVSGREVSARTIIRGNLRDYWLRLTRRWDNAKGAHAGFSEKELSGILLGNFRSIRNVSREYYVNKFPRFEKFWNLVYKLHIQFFFTSSLYFLAIA
jgi:SAM-dependent methyltransferase